MWSLKQPDNGALNAFLNEQRDQCLTYSALRATDDNPPAGFTADHHRIEIGRGRQTFNAACEALRKWAQYPPSWTRVYPPTPPLAPGQVVIVLARAYGVWWLNACRIVYVIDEVRPQRRFGFAYGTLPAHAECGEERFSIEWDDEDRVWYDIQAFSRPRYLPARILYPLARRLQRRFVLDSVAAMQQATSSVTQPTTLGQSLP